MTLRPFKQSNNLNCISTFCAPFISTHSTDTLYKYKPRNHSRRLEKMLDNILMTMFKKFGDCVGANF